MTEKASTCPQFIATKVFELHTKPTIKKGGELAHQGELLEIPQCKPIFNCSDTIRVDFSHAVNVCMNEDGDYENCPQFRGSKS
jgi:hypothetical protein